MDEIPLSNAPSLPGFLRLDAAWHATTICWGGPLQAIGNPMRAHCRRAVDVRAGSYRYDACGVVSSPPVRSVLTPVPDPTDRTIHARQIVPSDRRSPR
jgi:hypothetical protein